MGECFLTATDSGFAPLADPQVEAGHKVNQEALRNAAKDVHLVESELKRDADQVRSALRVLWAQLFVTLGI